MSVSQTIHEQAQNVNSPFTAFPVEIVRFILEFAGHVDSLSASRLLRVSHAVHDWVLPILYETLDISTPMQCMLLNQKLSSSPALARCVKNISVRVNEGDDDPYRSTVVAFPRAGTTAPRDTCQGAFQSTLVSILQLCQNVSSLNLTLSLDHLFRAAASDSNYVQTHTIYTSRITHLNCTSWDSWIYLSNHLHLYTSLTHLRVDPVYNSGMCNSWCQIMQDPTNTLPNLTHIVFGFDSRNSPGEFMSLIHLVNSLLERERLECLVVLGWYCWEPTQFCDVMSSIKDPRFRLLANPRCLDEKVCYEEWNTAARSGRDIWHQALETGISFA